MPKRITAIEVYPAAGGAPLPGDLLSYASEYPEINRTLGEPDELELRLHAGSPWDSVLKSRQKLRCHYDDESFEEWQVHEVRMSTAGTQDTTVVAWSIWTDLADQKVRRKRPDGSVELNVVFMGLTAEEVLEAILSDEYGCPALFRPGTVAAKYAGEKPVVQGVAPTHLDALRQLSERLGCEWQARWDGSVYRIDLVEKIGSATPGGRVIEAPTAYEAPSAANRVDLRVTDESDGYFNRVLPLCGDPEHPTTIAGAEWRVAEATYAGGQTQLTLGLEPYPVLQSGLLDGLKVGRGASKYAIASTTSPNVLTVTGDATALLGQTVRFFEADGSDLTFLEVPGPNGTVEVTMELPEISPDTNLFEQADGSADMTEGTTLPEGMAVFGPATAAFETEAIYVTHGRKSLRVQAAKDGGVETIDIPLAPTTERPYFSFWLNVRVLSGRITAQLVDAAGKLHPPSTTITYGGDIYREISVTGFEPAAGNARIRITALETGTEFVLDSLTLVQAQTATPYSPMMGPRHLFHEAARRLVEAGGASPVSYEGEFFDVSHLEGTGSEVMLGDTVRVRDRYRNGAWEIDFEGRVVAVRETEDKEFGRIRKEVRLERRAPSAVSRFVKAPTAPRGEEVPHKSEIEFAVKEGDTVTSLTLNLEGIHWDGKVFETTNWDGSFDPTTYRITDPGTIGAAITKAGDGAFENLWIRGELFVPSDFAGAQHTHDDRYLRLSGGTVTGDLGIAGGGILRGVENEMHVFAPDGTNHGTLVVQKLVIAGDATIIEGEKVALSDNFVLLNSDWTGIPSQNAGIEIEQGDFDNELLEFDQGLSRWGMRRAGGPFMPFTRSNQAETISQAWTFTPDPGAASKVFVFNHGYEFYVDNLNSQGDPGTRMWWQSPADGSVVFGPRGGWDLMSDFRVRSKNYDFETRSRATDPYGIMVLDGHFQASGQVGINGTFKSGFTGSGWRIDPTINGGHAEFGSLVVRGSLRVYELLINQIRATNGSLFVSSAAKATATAGGSFQLVDKDKLYIPFVQGDLVEARRTYTNGTGVVGVHHVFGYVNVIDNVNKTFTVSLGENSEAAVVGEDYDFVRVGYNPGRGGNIERAERMGAIYLTSDDSYAPYLDIYSGLAWAAHIDDKGGSGRLKARLGRLDGVGDTVAGRTVEGWGLYSHNAFLRGVIAVTKGYLGESGNVIVGDDLKNAGDGDGKIIIGNWSGSTFPIVRLRGSASSVVQIYYQDANTWGLFGRDASGADIFRLGSENFIGGVKFERNYMYIGSSPVFGSAAVPFFVNASGSFSLGNMLKWDAINKALTVEGTINATAGYFGTATDKWTIQDFGLSGGTDSTGMIRIMSFNGTQKRPWIHVGWYGPTASGGVAGATQGSNYIVLGAMTFLTGGGIGPHGNGWDYTGGGLSINAGGKAVFLAGERGGRTGLWIGGSGATNYMGYENGVLTVSGDIIASRITGTVSVTGGSIVAGNGSVTIGNSGIRLAVGGNTWNRIEWSNGARISDTSFTSKSGMTLQAENGDVQLWAGSQNNYKVMHLVAERIEIEGGSLLHFENRLSHPAPPSNGFYLYAYNNQMWYVDPDDGPSRLHG